MAMPQIKRILLCSAIVLSSTLAGLSPASAQWGFHPSEIMYKRYYYSDSSHTTIVGYEQDICHQWGIGSSATQGYYTDYRATEPFAFCREGYIYMYAPGPDF